LPAFGLISDAGNRGCPVWCMTLLYSTCLLLLPATCENFTDTCFYHTAQSGWHSQVRDKRYSYNGQLTANHAGLLNSAITSDLQ